jgi:hypothetical protein
MQSIRHEAKRNAEMATNIDNFRSRYKESNYDGDIDVTYPSGNIKTLDRNFFKLLAGSELVTFEPKWHQRPDYVSISRYNTPMFWQIILYINRIPSIEDFRDLESIYIPPYNLIIEVMRDRVSRSEIIDLDAVTETHSEARYFKIYPLDQREKNIISATERLT